MNRNEFPELIAALGEMYDMNFTEAKLELWFKTLERFPIAWVMKAFCRYVDNPATGKYPPRPAHIIEQVKALSEYVEAIAEKKAVSATPNTALPAPKEPTRTPEVAEQHLAKWREILLGS